MAAEYPISAYPRDLASFVQDRWQTTSGPGYASLPDPASLESLISVCYQASLLREEGRPVRFRLIFLPHDQLPSDLGPPAGLHRLLFRDKLPFNERELRKLSPSVDFYSSLIGLSEDGEGQLSIWGIVHSGARWTQSLYGGGKGFQPLPAALVISVTNPGRITVSHGSVEVATLNAGRIVGPAVAVFDSINIHSEFGSIFNPIADEELALHREARKRAKGPWAAIDPDFFGTIKKQIAMRILGRIRSYGHGGTLILIPSELKEEFLSKNAYIRFKYKFIDEEPCNRFRTIIVRIANALAEFYGPTGNPERIVGWPEYLTCDSQALSVLDESLFEWAHLVAGMAQVDGAVVMTHGMELVGFGAQISGNLERVDSVARALDPEGMDVRMEQTDNVGTRHHSSYSLCHALHRVLAFVVSQDGTGHLVKWNRGMLTVWDQLSPSLIEM